MALLSHFVHLCIILLTSKIFFHLKKLILRQMTRRLKENAFCAFITKDEKLQSIMEEFGFCILDSAHVPQQNFVLPANKKGKKNKSSDRSISSNCIVTIAQYSKGKKKIKGDTFYK